MLFSYSIVECGCFRLDVVDRNMQIRSVILLEFIFKLDAFLPRRFTERELYGKILSVFRAINSNNW